MSLVLFNSKPFQKISFLFTTQGAGLHDNHLMESGLI